MGELRRVEDSVQQQEFLGCGLPGPTVEFEQLIGHLCAQLCEFMRARQKTMDLYPSSFGPRLEKTCIRGFRQSEIQTNLFSYIH